MNKIYQKPFSGDKNAGFTLIELLVVVLIVGVLAAVALPQYTKAVYGARMKEAEIIMDSLHRSMVLFYTSEGTFPKKFEDLPLGLPAGCTTGDGYGIDTGTCRDKMTCGNITYCLPRVGGGTVVASFRFRKGFCEYCHFNKSFDTGEFVCRVHPSEIKNPSYFYQYCKSVGHTIRQDQ